MTDFSLKYMKYFPRKYMKSFPCKYMKTDFPHFPFMCQLLDTAAALSVSLPRYHQSDMWVIIILGRWRRSQKLSQLL